MNSKFELEFEFEVELELELQFEFMFPLEIDRKKLFGLREGQFWFPRVSFWSTLGAWEMDTCGNLASPRPDPIWGGEADPKVVILAVSSSPTREPDAVAARAHPPYPLDTFGGLRTNFSSRR